MIRASSRDATIRPRPVGGSEDLAREIASLSALDAETLRRRWKALIGADPLPYLGRSLMVRALAYRLQERALGGLKPATQRIFLTVFAMAARRSLRSGFRNGGPVPGPY